MPVLEDQDTAFADFVAARSPRLLHVAYLLTRDRGQAEDLLQTALAHAWSGWGRINGDPEAYVRRILINTYTAWWRRKWNGEIPTGRLPEPPVADPHRPVDDREEMLAALRRLPRQQRAVLVLRYYEDLSEVDIAELLGISPGTVKSHTHKALATLRLDAALAGSTLRPTAPDRPIALSAVTARIVQRRRRRIAAIGAACAVIIAIIIGYAVSPARRTAPPPTHPSPSPMSFGPFAEYADGMRTADVQDVLKGRTATFRWTATGRTVMVRFACRADESSRLTLRFQIRLNGGPPMEDGWCDLGVAGTVAGIYDPQQQAAAGIDPGEPAELTVALSDLALNAWEHDSAKRRVPLPKGAQASVGFSVEMAWEDYPFPPKAAPNPSEAALRRFAMGPPLIAAGPDPMAVRSAAFAMTGDYYAIDVMSDGPVRLRLIVAGVPFEICSIYTYGGHQGCRYNLNRQVKSLIGHLPPAGSAGTVLITVAPEHAAEPWSLWISPVLPQSGPSTTPRPDA